MLSFSSILLNLDDLRNGISHARKIDNSQYFKSHQISQTAYQKIIDRQLKAKKLENYFFSNKFLRLSRLWLICLPNIFLNIGANKDIGNFAGL